MKLNKYFSIGLILMVLCGVNQSQAMHRIFKNLGKSSFKSNLVKCVAIARKQAPKVLLASPLICSAQPESSKFKFKSERSFTQSRAFEKAKERMRFLATLDIEDYDSKEHHEFIKNIFDKEERFLGHMPEFKESKSAYTVKVIEVDGLPAGFVAYTMKQCIGYIEYFAIDGEYRGKGYGNELFSYAIKALKEMGAIEVKLMANPYNFNAQRFYENRGFSSTKHESGIIYNRNVLSEK